jgi:hypothetical protein
VIELLDSLGDAIAARDLPRVREIVNGPGSSALPQRVREEALSLAVLPAESLRAPIALWTFRHVTAQLDPSQLELPLTTA